jgi:hypothetical protein
MIAMKERSEADYKYSIFGKSINLSEANQATKGKTVQVIILFTKQNR